jgi:hypothetical protein
VSTALGAPIQWGFAAAQDAWFDAWLDAEPSEFLEPSFPEPSGCPATDAVDYTDTSYVLSGAGCIGPRSGDAYAGSLAVENALSFGMDSTQETSLDFSGWEAGSLAMEGAWSSSPTTDSAGAPIDSEQRVAITAADDGFTLSLDGALAIVATAGGYASTWGVDSTADVEGLGRFGVAGTVSWTSSPSGLLELTGADTLTVDLDDVDAAGCAAAFVDGEAVERVCLFAPAEPEPTAPSFLGGDRSCDGEDWVLQLTVAGSDVAFASAIIGGGDRREWHDLEETHLDGEARSFARSLAFEEPRVDDSHTSLACSGAEPVLFMAHDAEWTVVACATLGAVDAETLDQICSGVAVVALDG